MKRKWAHDFSVVIFRHRIDLQAPFPQCQCQDQSGQELSVEETELNPLRSSKARPLEI